MSYSYRERSKLENYETEREWTFATAETFSDFLREHDLTPEPTQREAHVDIQVGDGKTPEDIDAGTVLTKEIERVRKEAMSKAGQPTKEWKVPASWVTPAGEFPQPESRPPILEEIRRENIDRVLKAEYLRTPEDITRIRDVINTVIAKDNFELEDFTEANALLVLRPFGEGKQRSTFAVCSMTNGGITHKEPVRVFSAEESRGRTGSMQPVTVDFEDVINPTYLLQGSKAGEGKNHGCSEPIL